MNYPYYRQLLRIDPSTSSFDWLITQYNERENITESRSNQSGTTSVVGTTTNNGTSESTSNSNGTSNVISKNNGTSESSSTSTGTSNVVSKNDGTSKDTTTGSTTGNNQGFERQTGLSRVSPMSSDYTTDDMKERNNDKITVGDQSIRGYAHGMPYANIKNPSATSDTLTENGSLSAGTSETTTNGTTTANGTTDTTDSSTGTVTGTTTDNGTTTTADSSTGTVTGTTTDNGTTTTADSSTGTVTGTTNNTATNNSSTTGRNSNEANATVHEISSGRSQAIAEVLSQARGYILNSKAWVFLYKELDMCFCQSYLESEDE